MCFRCVCAQISSVTQWHRHSPRPSRSAGPVSYWTRDPASTVHLRQTHRVFSINALTVNVSIQAYCVCGTFHVRSCYSTFDPRARTSSLRGRDDGLPLVFHLFLVQPDRRERKRERCSQTHWAAYTGNNSGSPDVRVVSNGSQQALKKAHFGQIINFVFPACLIC